MLFLDKLTVFCVCVGDKYTDDYVYALHDMVSRYLSIDHDFKCITTRQLDGIETIKPKVPYSSWWSKIGLFYPGIATGPSLYFDLDVVITGNLDYLVDYTEQFSAPANWARSGHGGIQSSVMAWPGNWSAPYDYIKSQWPEIRERLWGDQEMLWEMLGDNWVRIAGIKSYKYHCQQGLADNMSVCVFHGEPKPIDVRDPWILPYIRIQDYQTRSDMPNICTKVS